VYITTTTTKYTIEEIKHYIFIVLSDLVFLLLASDDQWPHVISSGFVVVVVATVTVRKL